LDAGPDALDRQSLDLVQLVDTIAVDAEFECKQLDKQLKWTPLSEPIMFMGDLHWLGSAIENAVNNAIHFTLPGKTVELVLLQYQNKIQISIKDRGPGVNPDELKKIFNAFYQARSKTATDHKGTGVGLAIAKRVIEAHGGSIRAKIRNESGLEIQIFFMQ